MVNPAYMTRQIAEMAQNLNHTQLHITSLRPIRPANKADAWEAESLQLFETKGLEDRLSLIEDAAGGPVYRFMAPLRVKQSCLKCHAKQGYQVGDIRGGISVTMPAVLLLALADTHQLRETAAFLFGFAVLAVLSHVVTARTRSHLLALATINRNQESVIAERTRGLKNAVEALEAGQQDARVAAAVFDTTADGIIVTDDRFRITRVNPAFVGLTGAGAADVVGQHALDLLSREGRPERPVLEIALGETRRWAGEVTLRRRNGLPVVAWVSITTVADGAHVGHLVITLVDITERKQTEEHAWHLAYHDPLTGLPNRKLFEDHLLHAHASARRHERHYAVLYLDLDHFKEVNDTLGHAAGDALLQECAHRMLQCVREEDTVARLGGDEFAVILAETHDLDGVCRTAQRIIDAIARPFQLSAGVAHVGASIGVATYPQHGDEVVVLTRKADIALYAAKAAGRGRYVLGTDAQPLPA